MDWSERVTGVKKVLKVIKFKFYLKVCLMFIFVCLFVCFYCGDEHVDEQR